MSESCKTCRFYVEKRDDCGHCWRYPPTIFGRVEGDSSGEIDTFPNQNRPFVLAGEFCGEWKLAMTQSQPRIADGFECQS